MTHFTDKFTIKKVRAVFFIGDWVEEYEPEILVTHVRNGELDSDAILRAMEIYGADKEYFIKEIVGAI